MSVNSITVARQQFTGAGSTFNCTFGAQNASDIVVTQTTAGVTTTLTLNSNYTVASLTNDSFTVNLSVSQGASTTLTVYTNPPETQTQTFSNATAFDAVALTTALDHAILDIKALNEVNTRELTLPTSISTTFNGVLPAASVVNNGILMFNSTATGFTTTTAAAIVAGGTTGQLLLPQGTNSAPEIIFTNNTTTGISAPISNSLNIDAQGNLCTQFISGNVSAVNYITNTNAATGSAPAIGATGTDSAVSLNLTTKGTGTVQINGSPAVLTTGTCTTYHTPLFSGSTNNTLFDGGAAARLEMGGRLTASSTLSAPGVDASGATLYYLPHISSLITLYDGIGWVKYDIGASGISSSSFTSSMTFDVFIYNNGGTLTLEFINWTNDTTRATALGTQDGVWVKNGTPTHRYIGTCRSIGTSVLDVSYARLIWNMYNRIYRGIYYTNNGSASGYSYTTTTIRQVNADGNAILYSVFGLSQDMASVLLTGVGSTTTNAPTIGFGINSTSVYTKSYVLPVVSTKTTATLTYTSYLPIGFNEIFPLETGATGATLYGADASSITMYSMF